MASIFKWIVLNEMFRTFIEISLKIILKDPIDNKSSLGPIGKQHAIAWTNIDQDIPSLDHNAF